MTVKAKPEAVDPRKTGEITKVEITSEMRDWLKDLARHYRLPVYKALERVCREAVFKAYRGMVLEKHKKVANTGV